MTRRAWKLALPRAKCPSCGALLRLTGLFSRWKLEQVSGAVQFIHRRPRASSMQAGGIVAAGTDPAAREEEG